MTVGLRVTAWSLAPCLVALVVAVGGHGPGRLRCYRRRHRPGLLPDLTGWLPVVPDLAGRLGVMPDLTRRLTAYRLTA